MYEKFLTSFHIEDSVKPVHRHDMPRQCSLNHQFSILSLARPIQIKWWAPFALKYLSLLLVLGNNLIPSNCYGPIVPLAAIRIIIAMFITGTKDIIDIMQEIGSTLSNHTTCNAQLLEYITIPTKQCFFAFQVCTGKDAYKKKHKIDALSFSWNVKGTGKMTIYKK